MREKRWLLLALCGIVLANAVSAAVKPTRPKFKIATTSTTTTSTTTTEENENEDPEPTTTTVATETNGTTGHTLTGIPQIDYIWDPNLPRELNGYNLSDYPFYNSIPEDIDFKCDGLHDGFYASVPHKCQVYHHCLFGTRYDFLCANFTAFDQKTFICHFVSEVDCANSKKYWHRNDALYKAATTTTTSTSTTTTTTTTPSPAPVEAGRSRDRDPPRRRWPLRRRPAYDYYDDEYYDDEYSRPRGYSRDDYDYEDRKYTRDRHREFRDRDRDFRERDGPRPRDGIVRDDRDRDTSARDRYQNRNNRRDPTRMRDLLHPLEEDAKVRPRDPESGPRSASREVDEAELEDRRSDSRVRDTDDRRYSDKRYRDEYDDKVSAPSSAVTETKLDGLVKPAAPIASVYARPRAPPKIRRPVPLSEQDKYAYKSTTVQPTEDSRRRPVDMAEDDYYEDELEDFRPVRRPHRRRPSYRERERDFYDSRDRERDRDRVFRGRYRDEEEEEEEELRPRKHPDRSRDRYYDRERDRGDDRGVDRGRDRSLDRSKDRPVDRDRGRTQDADKSDRPYSTRVLDRERDVDRSRTGSRGKELQDSTDLTGRKSNGYDRTTSSATTTTCLPEQLVHKSESNAKDPVNDRSERPTQERPARPLQSSPTRPPPIEQGEPHRTNQQQSAEYPERDQDDRREQSQYQTGSLEEYSQDYYDEPDDPPAPPPRATVRIVKRPFLPSRGGNSNPRGLSSVGSKATTPKREEDRPTERSTVQERPNNYYGHDTNQQSPSPRQESKARQEEKESYDAYKAIHIESQREHTSDDYDTSIARPAVRRPVDRQRENEHKSADEPYTRGTKQGQQQADRQDFDDGLAKWPSEDYSSEGNAQTPSSSVRNKGRLTASESPNVYGSSYKTDENQEHPTGPANLRVKQRINEVTHRLQDIPESEYDVTLNDALTPTLNQEPNLPSGFVLPLHRQIGRDPVLESSENNYKVSRPVNQQQKPFVASPQFLPAANGDRLRTMYYRPSESIQLSGTQYRQTGPWQDYTGY
ncbi:uncharacterized protein DDB_G0284459 [Hylaeus anthracinus]|uniref:uncharacterized protein DDB_G0284459 n=1 Tax=Hylaeus anthracinus TaxID=313031 RepID=UPI0023B9C330|nr:uncharacterized protein DDB_G0284459 [Hylaeus anthracinus]XP_054009077.1 uncharacterized protein DDB_G0284459 [Hylaeus anthracinus]